MKLYEFDTPFVLLEQVLNELERTKDELIAMRNRLLRIIDTSEFEGEKSNAKDLLLKVEKQLKDQHDWSPNQSQRKTSKTRQTRTGGSYAHQKASQAYQKPHDNEFKVVFFGNYVDPGAGKRGSNKVWGWGVKYDKIYQFWGPYNGTPQVKVMNNTAFNRDALKKKQRQKVSRGYQKLSAAENAEWILQVLRRNPKFTD